MPAAVRGERPSRGGRRGRRGPGRSEITSRPERREGRPATASSGYARRHRGPRDRNRKLKVTVIWKIVLMPGRWATSKISALMVCKRYWP